ncbi:MAG: hypothetical protein LC772_09715, partial [Chloroflexi bacterium]|nr:hypothetical protein [Chloroflexota bacterium]
ISTDHYSAADLLPGSDWIAPRDNAAALAAAIRRACKAWEEARRTGSPLPLAPRPGPFSAAATRLADLVDSVAGD